MPASPSPQPQLKQKSSTGWAWPHLVNKKEQKEKPSQAKNINAVPKHVPAAPPLRNLQQSRDLSALREEQSAPTSPTHSPGSPLDSMSGQSTEVPENANAVDDQPKLVDFKATDVILPEESSHKPEDQNDEHGERIEGGHIRDEVVEDAKHPNDSLPGAFPITPAAIISPGDLFPGLAQASLLPTLEEADMGSRPTEQFPGLAQAGLLPAVDQTAVTAEPDTKGARPTGQLLSQFGLMLTRLAVQDRQHPQMWAVKFRFRSLTSLYHHLSSQFNDLAIAIFTNSTTMSSQPNSCERLSRAPLIVCLLKNAAGREVFHCKSVLKKNVGSHRSSRRQTVKESFKTSPLTLRQLPLLLRKQEKW